jgi:hypothetical protein
MFLRQASGRRPTTQRKVDSVSGGGFRRDSFNAGDRAAALNNGSYCEIPREIRSHVNVLFERFVLDHIDARSSFALETTLRSAVTFEQAASARRASFVAEMRCLCLPKLRDAPGKSEDAGRTGTATARRSRSCEESTNSGSPMYENGEWGKTPVLLLQAEVSWTSVVERANC